MLLEVTVKDPASTSNRTKEFSESPVRIGRNQLNDIPIDDPFVSQWHGMIRFDEEGVAYFDLGSTNGSVLDGERLAKNVPASLTDKSRIMLGRIELTIARRVSEAPWSDSGSRHTMAWGHQNASRAPSRTPSSPSEIGIKAPGKSSAYASQSRSLAATPAGAPSVTPAGGSSASSTVEAALLLRHRQILEAFSEAFIGLRKGYQQFGAEVGVRTINGRTVLHRSRTTREIIDYLLQPDLDVALVKRDLIAIFADFGIHHIAMMEAVTEGVRALLQSLDPRANDLEGGGRLFSAAKGKSQWKAYVERFDQVLTDDQDLHAAIFGAEFARTYAKVTLGDGAKRGEPDDE